MPRLNPATRLSELRERAQTLGSTCEVDARLVRSVEQSLRVEGYAVTEADVRLGVTRVLGNRTHGNR